MNRIAETIHLRPSPRLRLRKICRSCLYREPDRRALRSPVLAGSKPPVIPRSHCRYTLQTEPPLFRQRKR